MKNELENTKCCGSERPILARPSRRGAKLVAPKKPVVHPDHGAHLNRINRAVGQLNGVKRMIEDRRYCPEILTQVRAARAAMRSVELLILGTHLRHCVAEAAQAQAPELSAAKIEELVTLLEQY